MTGYIVWFDQLSMKDVGLVGGKNASLGEMIRHLSEAGVNVPTGFATTTNAYQVFLAENDRTVFSYPFGGNDRLKNDITLCHLKSNFFSKKFVELFSLVFIHFCHRDEKRDGPCETLLWSPHFLSATIERGKLRGLQIAPRPILQD